MKKVGYVSENKKMNQIRDILNKLAKSNFRNQFHLKEKEIKYIDEKGMDKIEEHCIDFIHRRIASQEILNDGKQTPMKGHPVFIAQHATATCCRGCLFNWHKIEKNKKLTIDEENYIVNFIMVWIKKEYENNKNN